MFGKKKEKKYVPKKYLICPHCEEKIQEDSNHNDEGIWFGLVLLVGCPHCKKIIGSFGEL